MTASCRLLLPRLFAGVLHRKAAKQIHLTVSLCVGVMRFLLWHHIESTCFSTQGCKKCFCLLRLFYLLKMLLRRILRCFHGESAEEILKFQSLTQQIGFLCIQIGNLF